MIQKQTRMSSLLKLNQKRASELQNLHSLLRWRPKKGRHLDRNPLFRTIEFHCRNCSFRFQKTLNLGVNFSKTIFRPLGGYPTFPVGHPIMMIKTINSNPLKIPFSFARSVKNSNHLGIFKKSQLFSPVPSFIEKR